MMMDKIHETISFKQSEWFEKNISFNQKREKRLRRTWKKTSINYLVTHFMEKQWKMYEID